MVLVRLGQAAMRAGHLQQAQTDLKQAAQCDKDNPVIADALSELALMQNDFKAAVEHALEAVSLAHFFPRAHYHLGCGLANLGESEHAIAAFRTCLHLAPNFTPAHEKLAALLPDGQDAHMHQLTASSARTISALA